MALRKEISSLEKRAVFYTAVLERHQPFCRLRGRGSGSAAPPSVSSPVSAQASASTSAATPSASFGGRSPLTPSCELFSTGSSISSPHTSVKTAAAPHSLFHDPSCDPPLPPPQTPCPGSVPQTPPDPLAEILIDSKLSPSHQAAASPGLLLSLLTVPSPPRGPQTSDGSLAQMSLLEDTSRDLGFQELLEVNEWILQEPEMDPAFS